MHSLYPSVTRQVFLYSSAVLLVFGLDQALTESNIYSRNSQYKTTYTRRTMICTCR